MPWLSGLWVTFESRQREPWVVRHAMGEGHRQSWASSVQNRGCRGQDSPKPVTGVSQQGGESVKDADSPRPETPAGPSVPPPATSLGQGKRYSVQSCPHTGRKRPPRPGRAAPTAPPSLTSSSFSSHSFCDRVSAARSEIVGRQSARQVARHSRQE